MIAFLLEQDLNAERSLNYPGLYGAGQLGLYFSIKAFWVWVVQGIWHGSVCFWIPVLVSYTSVNSSGLIHHLWWVSTLTFSLVINTITLKLYIQNKHWNVYSA